MLDPVINFFEWIFDRIGRGIGYIIAALLWPFVAFAAWTRKRGVIIKGLVAIIILAIVFGYGFFTFQTQYWRGFNTNFAANYDFGSRSSSPGEEIAGQAGQCGPSAIIQVAADLTDFNVNQNTWIPSSLVSKMGLFGLDWKYTPWFDNKAAFQLGINNIVRRTTFEAVDRLGRVRGTSQIDQSLQDARQNINYPEDRWWFSFSPLGFASPTPSFYRRAAENLNEFNAKLENCTALFDPRADNLLRFLDQMSNTMGSTSDVLSRRIEASSAGWFDTRADDRFWFTYGQLYALNGIMAGAKADFDDVVLEKKLSKVWDKMQGQLKAALEIDPLIVSNAAQDAFIMPSHLSTMGYNLLQVRTSMTEMRDVLDR